VKQKKEMLDSFQRAATPVFAIIILSCSLFLIKSNIILASVIFVSSLIVLLEKAVWHFFRVKKMKEYISDVASDEDELQNNEALFKSMNPIAGIRIDGSVAWYNSAFKNLFGIISEKKISELIPELNIRKIYNRRCHGWSFGGGDRAYHGIYGHTRTWLHGGGLLCSG